MQLKDHTLPLEQIPDHCPVPLSDERRRELKAEIAQRLQERDAVLIAH